MVLPLERATEIELPESTMRELRDGLHARQMVRMQAAAQQQRELAKAGGERMMMQHGETVFSVLPEFYHYWGQRLGYECWDNAQFVREFLRDNPEVRVKNVSRNATVRVPDVLPRKVKSSTKYAF